MSWVRRLAVFCWDFLVGDDWRLAAVVVSVAATDAVATRAAETHRPREKRLWRQVAAVGLCMELGHLEWPAYWRERLR